jgi:hypothetical protein
VHNCILHSNALERIILDRKGLANMIESNVLYVLYVAVPTVADIWQPSWATYKARVMDTLTHRKPS